MHAVSTIAASSGQTPEAYKNHSSGFRNAEGQPARWSV
jgi:hypothetical protein